MIAAVQRAVPCLSVLYLIVLVVICGLIHLYSGSWWPVTLILFSPRWVVAVPLLILVPLTLATRSRLTLIYLLHCVLIAFPILGYRVSWAGHVDSDKPRVLRVLTCNLGGGTVNTDQLATLATSHDIHVLMLQECSSSVSKRVFDQLGWAYRQESNITIGSSLELGAAQIVARGTAAHSSALVAMSCELRFPSTPSAETGDENPSPDSGSVHLVSLHLPTFRPALAKVRRFDFDAGRSIEDMGTRYAKVVERVLQNLHRFDAPMVIAGDFNVPVESAYFRRYWSDYQNTFSQAGTGLGYTKYTRFHGIRIDHILADSNWNIESALVGPGFGGDHCAVVAELSLTR